MSDDLAQRVLDHRTKFAHAKLQTDNTGWDELEWAIDLVRAELEAVKQMAEAEFAEPGWNSHYRDAGQRIAEKIGERQR